MKKLIIFIALISVFALVTTACGSKEESSSSYVVTDKSHPHIGIDIKGGSYMVFELYPEYAPETVKNFISLAKSGFYNGLKFHRIIKDFMVQGGDPKGDGTGGSDKNIKGEFSANGFTQNTLLHKRGVISMARSQDYNSASSQFFIMTADTPSLDGQYAAFGKMIAGDKTLDSIANTPVAADPNSGEASKPTKDVIIKTVKVLND